MARIRTIKPEFFTSDDICTLPMATRLLYIGIWCEADKEGRLEWSPRNLKRRYLPDDILDIHELCDELINSGLVVLYGDGLAYVPTFAKHQHINPRESASRLPDPAVTARVTHASSTREARDSDAQGGREGKGREGKEKKEQGASPTGSRLSPDWKASETEMRWARDARPDLDLTAEVERFRDYWHGVAGAKGRKADWPATWRNWIRGARSANGLPASTTAHIPGGGRPRAIA